MGEIESDWDAVVRGVSVARKMDGLLIYTADPVNWDISIWKICDFERDSMMPVGAPNVVTKLETVLGP
jgi:hypothetical protein